MAQEIEIRERASTSSRLSHESRCTPGLCPESPIIFYQWHLLSTKRKGQVVQFADDLCNWFSTHRCITLMKDRASMWQVYLNLKFVCENPYLMVTAKCIVLCSPVLDCSTCTVKFRYVTTKEDAKTRDGQHGVLFLSSKKRLGSQISSLHQQSPQQSLMESICYTGTWLDEVHSKHD